MVKAMSAIGHRFLLTYPISALFFYPNFHLRAIREIRNVETVIMNFNSFQCHVQTLKYIVTIANSAVPCRRKAIRLCSTTYSVDYAFLRKAIHALSQVAHRYTSDCPSHTPIRPVRSCVSIFLLRLKLPHYTYFNSIFLQTSETPNKHGNSYTITQNSDTITETADFCVIV